MKRTICLLSLVFQTLLLFGSNPINVPYYEIVGEMKSVDVDLGCLDDELEYQFIATHHLSQEGCNWIFENADLNQSVLKIFFYSTKEGWKYSCIWECYMYRCIKKDL